MKRFLAKVASCVMALTALFALSSCSQYALVNSQTYNNADLSAYKTFRIVTPDSINKLPPGMQMVTYYNIAAAIRDQLYMRGMTEDPNSPLLVNIGLTEHKEISTEPLSAAIPPPPVAGPPYPYYGPAYGGLSPWFMYPRGYYWPGYYNNVDPNAQVITGIYEEGVLTMDMINYPRKEALYSASVAAILDGKGVFLTLSGIEQAVKTLFSKFPVPLLPQYRNNK